MFSSLTHCWRQARPAALRTGYLIGWHKGQAGKPGAIPITRQWHVLRPENDRFIVVHKIESLPNGKINELARTTEALEYNAALEELETRENKLQEDMHVNPDIYTLSFKEALDSGTHYSLYRLLMPGETLTTRFFRDVGALAKKFFLHEPQNTPHFIRTSFLYEHEKPGMPQARHKFRHYYSAQRDAHGHWHVSALTKDNEDWEPFEQTTISAGPLNWTRMQTHLYLRNLELSARAEADKTGRLRLESKWFGPAHFSHFMPPSLTENIIAASACSPRWDLRRPPFHPAVPGVVRKARI
jgi:hypothetical protein